MKMETLAKFREIFVKIWAKLNENDQILQKFAEKYEEVWRKFCWNIKVWAVQKHVNLVDLVKSFRTDS